METGAQASSEVPEVRRWAGSGPEGAQTGATEVHLFYKGPVTMAMAIGAVTDNWVPIKVYEYTQGAYRLNLVLEKETVKGLFVGDAVSEAEELLTGI